MSNIKKDLKIAISYVERNGFKLVRHNKHMIFKCDEHTLTLSSTPGNQFLLQTIQRDMRRMGMNPLPINA